MSDGLFDLTYYRIPGFRRVRAKASGRSLAYADDCAEIQVGVRLHAREGGQPKSKLSGSSGETIYALYVSWLNERAFLDLRRIEDGAWVAHAVARTEGEAMEILAKEIERLGI